MPSGESKSDMERLGIFKEMSYITVGETYAPPTQRPFNRSAYRSRQMQAGVAKQRCALQSGFFDKSFNRIFEREALSDPLKLARQNRIQQAKKNLGKAFLPCNGVKNLCGSGSYYGTLSGPIEAMSPLSVVQKSQRPPGRNIVTSPPKMGSGYSYPNVTLSNVELYASDPYDRAKEIRKKEAAINRSKMRDGPFKLNLHPRDYFQHNPYHSDKPLPPAQKPLPPTPKVSPLPFKPPSPSKRIGGMKAGTFDAYPSHSTDPYVIRQPKKTYQEPIFYPPPGPKSTPVKSIITVNVNRLALGFLPWTSRSLAPLGIPSIARRFQSPHGSAQVSRLPSSAISSA
ncbi:cilia-and flagella-associated protein 96 [Pholidichthys leucotaenia]